MPETTKTTPEARPGCPPPLECVLTCWHTMPVMGAVLGPQAAQWQHDGKRVLMNVLGLKCRVEIREHRLKYVTCLSVYTVTAMTTVLNVPSQYSHPGSGGSSAYQPCP